MAGANIGDASTLASADNIDAADGNDTVYSGYGDDTLNGGAGSDLLYGGTGADVFVFGKYSSNNSDIIGDFAVGQDNIRITDFSGITSFASIQPLMTTSGGNTVIDFGAGNTLTLQGVSVASLTANDFIFA